MCEHWWAVQYFIPKYSIAALCELGMRTCDRFRFLCAYIISFVVNQIKNKIIIVFIDLIHTYFVIVSYLLLYTVTLYQTLKQEYRHLFHFSITSLFGIIIENKWSALHTFSFCLFLCYNINTAWEYADYWNVVLLYNFGRVMHLGLTKFHTILILLIILTINSKWIHYRPPKKDFLQNFNGKLVILYVCCQL